jgi:diguanylate cyclase (GGDEF)-like protein
VEFRLGRANLPETWLEAVARPNPANNSVHIGLRNVTKRHQELDQLRRAATYDPLTGALNREGIREVAESSLATPGDHVTYVFFIDLDGFKPVNDLHGHHAGDFVLCTIVRRLGAVLANGEHLARLGGDEFAIVGGAAADVLRFRLETERLASVISEPIALDHGSAVVSVTASIGSVTASTDSTVDELFDAADRDMYRHKHDICYVDDSPRLSLHPQQRVHSSR